MRAIYEPKGKAKEYCELALNLYTGCEHGCVYCYVPMILRKNREEFRYRAIPRWEAMEQLRKEVHKYKGRTVFLCFTCDPYQLEQNYITREALEILLPNGVNVEILTKAGLRSWQDIELLKQYKEQVNYGATLTFYNEVDSKQYEPYAALSEERTDVLYAAKFAGLKTWVSLEPVIDIKQSLKLIDETIHYVDEYRIGKLNYFPLPKPIDWQVFLVQAIMRFKQYGKKYLIKESLKPYLKEA
jgi:DNA repair photolyase